MDDPWDDKRQAQLLDAVLHVTSGLDLSEVLQHVVEAAVTLVEARHGALGVLDQDGHGLAEFVHTGFPEDVVRRIGSLPEGRGILGLLIEEPHPLRLRHLGDHPAASGFPTGHPAMSSFLGAPIRVRGDVWGNLYLTDKESAEEFSRADEHLVVGLAAVAGAAIDNARLYESSRRREQWLDALQRVTTAMLDLGDPDEALHDIVEAARGLVDADVANLAIPTSDDGFVVTAARGALAAQLRGVHFAAAGSLSQRALERAATVVTVDVSRWAGGPQPVARLGAFGPAMFVPLVIRGQGLGAITLANLKGARPFADAHPGIVETFARQAGLALERERHRRDLARLDLLEDRERIGRDLHDNVIQQLFVVGLDLESIAGRIGLADERAAGRLEEAVATLDDTIRDIRNTIFAVRQQEPATITERVKQVSAQAAAALGFRPRLKIDAAADGRDVPPDLAEDVAAVLREALTNVARHAGAQRVDVVVEVGAALRLCVADDGRGVSDASRPREDGTGCGLGNMRARAEARGGRCHLRSARGGGTIVDWRVPLAH